MALEESFDAIVIGGGPAGWMAALLLAMPGWSIAVLERQRFPSRKVCGEYVSASNLPLLDAVGLGDHFRAAAGPAVKRVGLFARGTTLDADLLLPRGYNSDWGTALRREHLDAMLLEHAAKAGAVVFQPWSAVGMEGGPNAYECRARSRDLGQNASFRSRAVIAAHGCLGLVASCRRSGHAGRIDPTICLASKPIFARLVDPRGSCPYGAFRRVRRHGTV